jgi:hypothetical protein
MKSNLLELIQRLQQCPAGWKDSQIQIIVLALTEIDRVQTDIINGLVERVAIQAELLSKKAESKT